MLARFTYVASPRHPTFLFSESASRVLARHHERHFGFIAIAAL